MINAKQMREYKITLDFSKSYQLLKKYKLREYKGSFPTIKLTARTPDHACFLVIENLVQLLRDQDVSEPIVNRIKRKSSVKTVICND